MGGVFHWGFIDCADPSLVWQERLRLLILIVFGLRRAMLRVIIVFGFRRPMLRVVLVVTITVVLKLKLPVFIILLLQLLLLDLLQLGFELVYNLFVVLQGLVVLQKRQEGLLVGRLFLNIWHLDIECHWADIEDVLLLRIAVFCHHI